MKGWTGGKNKNPSPQNVMYQSFIEFMKDFAKKYFRSLIYVFKIIQIVFMLVAVIFSPYIPVVCIPQFSGSIVEIQ